MVDPTPGAALGRPRQSRAPNGRARLLAAARTEFGRAGYAAATVNDIVAAARVNAPTLYHHFESKEGLFVASAHEAYEEVLGVLRAACDETKGDFRASIEAILNASVQLIQRSESLAQLFLVIQVELARQPSLEVSLRPILRDFREFFDELATRPGAPADDPYLGRALVAILNGLNAEALLLRSPARDYPGLITATLSLLR